VPGAARPRSIAANSAALAIAQTVVKVLGVGVVFVLTRAVSVEAYGRYAFAAAFAAMFLPIGDPGADFHTTRMVSRHPERASEYLGASLALKTALLPLLALTSLSVAWFTGHRGESLLLVVYAVLAVWLLVMGSSYLAVLRGMRRMDYEAYFLIVTRVAAVGLTLAALAVGQGVLAVGAIQVVANALGIPLVMFYASRVGIAPRRERLRALVRELLTGGVPFAATGLLVMIYFRVDMLMLSQMRGERSVGLYGAGTNLMFSVLIASQVLVGAVFPVIARSRSLADPEARSVGRRAMTLSLLMSLPFAVGACVVSGPVLALLYGHVYAAGAPALMFLMLTLPWLFVNNLVGNCLGAVGRQRVVLLVAGINLAINVGLNLVLIPRMDYAGAALATLLSEICGTGMMAIALRGDMAALFPVRTLLGLLAANAVLAGLLLLLRAWPIVPVLAIAGLAYLGLVLVMRLVRFSDLRSLLPAAGNGAAA
jgi:O-antigen/teichoic acid export membrane protein